MIPLNPFPVWKEFFNFIKYRELIDNSIIIITNDFNSRYKIIEVEKVKDSFWKLATLQKEINPEDWYDVFGIFIGRLMYYEILGREKSNAGESYQIHKEWFEYLSTRINPHIGKLPINFLEELYSYFPTHDTKSRRSKLEEIKDMIEQYEIYKIFEDPNINPYKKIRSFKEQYINFYELFLDRCKLIGDELSKYEGNKQHGRYGKDLYKIFQIWNNNEYTPPDFIRDLIITLIHIRNACAHSGLTLIGKTEVQIIDKKSNGQITYNVICQINELMRFIINLFLLDKEFENIALLIYVIIWIKKTSLEMNLE